MTVELLENPAEPVVEDDGSYGGFSAIARLLSEQQPGRERPYSRQLVHKWYINREWNNFPESRQVRSKTGKVKTMFVLADVDSWHRTYRATRRGRPPIETIPLFQLTADGLAVY